METVNAIKYQYFLGVVKYELLRYFRQLCDSCMSTCVFSPM